MTQTPQRYKIKRALLSVSDKSGLLEFARTLQVSGVELISTGGTKKYLAENGLAVKDVSDVTGFPEIMDGRVKTLHPKIHGGLLSVRDNDTHIEAQKSHSIDDIDMLVVNLYPFRETVARGGDYDTCVENIDIGGPAMLRAASKNHAFVTVVTDPADYAEIATEIKLGGTTLVTRKKLAAKTYAATASYDAAIASWFAGQLGETFPPTISLPATRLDTLRYGENPHQSAAVYSDGTKRPGVVTAQKIQGKELSFNNLNDTDAAFEIVAEFSEPAVAIIKHANPCGVAIGKDALDAYRRALACDPVSAFGGIIALNRKLDAVTAAEILKVFSEVIIAPAIDEDAKPVLAAKPNVRVLITGEMPDPKAPRMTVRTIAGGYLLQNADIGHITAAELNVVTKRSPTDDEVRDMLFAFRVAKHVKSNAIVYARENVTIGIGAGQMNRLDSSRIAAARMKEYGLVPPENAPMAVASDAFFPFADGMLAAADAGATAIIQPGGSIKDKDVIAAADERGLAMVFTGIRHFRH
ncbi:MAG: bifunctional phosphoribosylaminoimidazolecarboxamide formyltransferase/inosine monophosphate cyclohydrolase [Micavibrio aeruginosavorus]|uniref:Bifunctional purine biosynthesis protein PurH n=1 Tax=Micavibrio aeruginosavorus TaxID=349221 RepID=A0A2W5FN40_9BACT|nr:MAG: bifunctional phosphoribosylaminoimidazolecarboxamide formyltransferase/inosine monophosphate cyclohydrolase [Micavibrio aeruginosavorus]